MGKAGRDGRTAIMFSKHSGIFGQKSARIYNNFFPNEEML
jgi:hypothetical protein